MSKVKVCGFTVSIDGFGAGPEQSLERPLGIGGESLHHWLISTRTFQTLFGDGKGTEGIDDAYAKRSFENVGAWIMGRNMFGPIRGEWPDDKWRGWWGENPPYHMPVYVLTHYPRAPLEMDGGTTFYFITGGIHEAMERARQSAGAKDIRIGGGASTIRQYLQAGMIDEMHLAISPTILGRGEALFADIDLLAAGFKCIEHVTTEHALHVVLSRLGNQAL
jgi:dihydrofolate reductase